MKLFSYYYELWSIAIFAEKGNTKVKEFKELSWGYSNMVGPLKYYKNTQFAENSTDRKMKNQFSIILNIQVPWIQTPQKGFQASIQH